MKTMNSIPTCNGNFYNAYNYSANIVMIMIILLLLYQA